MKAMKLSALRRISIVDNLATIYSEDLYYTEVNKVSVYIQIRPVNYLVCTCT